MDKPVTSVADAVRTSDWERLEAEGEPMLLALLEALLSLSRKKQKQAARALLALAARQPESMAAFLLRCLRQNKQRSHALAASMALRLLPKAFSAPVVDMLHQLVHLAAGDGTEAGKRRTRLAAEAAESALLLSTASAVTAETLMRCLPSITGLLRVYTTWAAGNPLRAAACHDAAAHFSRVAAGAAAAREAGQEKAVRLLQALVHRQWPPLADALSRSRSAKPAADGAAAVSACLGRLARLRCAAPLRSAAELRICALHCSLLSADALQSLDDALLAAALAPQLLCPDERRLPLFRALTHALRLAGRPTVLPSLLLPHLLTMASTDAALAFATAGMLPQAAEALLEHAPLFNALHSALRSGDGSDGSKCIALQLLRAVAARAFRHDVPSALQARLLAMLLSREALADAAQQRAAQLPQLLCQLQPAAVLPLLLPQLTGALPEQLTEEERDDAGEQEEAKEDAAASAAFLTADDARSLLAAEASPMTADALLLHMLCHCADMGALIAALIDCLRSGVTSQPALPSGKAAATPAAAAAPRSPSELAAKREAAADWQPHAWAVLTRWLADGGCAALSRGAAALSAGCAKLWAAPRDVHVVRLLKLLIPHCHHSCTLLVAAAAHRMGAQDGRPAEGRGSGEYSDAHTFSRLAPLLLLGMLPAAALAADAERLPQLLRKRMLAAEEVDAVRRLSAELFARLPARLPLAMAEELLQAEGIADGDGSDALHHRRQRVVLYMLCHFFAAAPADAARALPQLLPRLLALLCACGDSSDEKTQRAIVDCLAMYARATVDEGAVELPALSSSAASSAAVTAEQLPAVIVALCAERAPAPAVAALLPCDAMSLASRLLAAKVLLSLLNQLSQHASLQQALLLLAQPQLMRCAFPAAADGEHSAAEAKAGEDEDDGTARAQCAAILLTCVMAPWSAGVVLPDGLASSCAAVIVDGGQPTQLRGVALKLLGALLARRSDSVVADLGVERLLRVLTVAATSESGLPSDAQQLSAALLASLTAE